MNTKTIDINNKVCTGCSACIAICPTRAISFIRNIEGFNTPIIDKVKCINCGKCKSVCCLEKNKIQGVTEGKQEANAAITLDNKLWKESSSGGAFSEICKAVNELAKIENNQVIFCGAVLEDKNVFHKCVEKLEEIDVFKKSKYVQSDLKECFLEIKKNLESEKYVVFSGVPCQIYGLRSFLGKKYERLFCIDLICHGVGSPEIFEQCLKNEEIKEKKKIKKYQFRYKDVKLGNIERYTSYYLFEDGTEKKIKYDNYNKLFLNQVCLRSSCGENCKFRNIDRQGDITIADFNNKIKVFPEISDYRNYSTVVFNNIQGKKLKKTLEKNMKMYKCNVAKICMYNPLFYRTTNGNLNRDKFFKEYREGEKIEKLVKKYGLKRSFGIDILFQYIPYKIKRIVFEIIRRQPW